jgi:hypothetical protein
MIPFEEKPPPADFEEKVGKKGRAWLRESGLPLSGRLPRGHHPLNPIWTECLDDLYDAYGGICAYMCIFIEKVVGTPTVDHYIAKSRAVQHAYRWRNYRLASLTMNQRKGNHGDVLDPFTLPEETFHLNLVDGGIFPNAALATRDPALHRKAVATIARLRL